MAEIEGRHALAEGRVGDAERAFDVGVTSVRRRGAPEAEAQALAGRAEARWAAGRREASLADSAAAHAALWGGTSLVPIDAGAAAFLSARPRMTERYVASLLELGRPAEALVVVRAARSHLVCAGHLRARLEALDPDAQRRWDDALARYPALRAEMEAATGEAWRLSAEEESVLRETNRTRDVEARRALDEAMAAIGQGPVGPPAFPPPSRGDLLLAWFPVGSRWVGFAASGDDVTAHWISRPTLPASDEALGAALLGAFAEPIAAAQRVVLPPGGSFARSICTPCPSGARRSWPGCRWSTPSTWAAPSIQAAPSVEAARSWSRAARRTTRAGASSSPTPRATFRAPVRRPSSWDVPGPAATR